MVCLRNISVDTLHKGDTEDDDNNDGGDDDDIIIIIIIITTIIIESVHTDRCGHALR